MMRPLILAISLCFPSNAPSSSMCSCLIRPMSDSARGIAELRTADIVFVGRVTSVVDTTQAGGVVHFRRATFAVQLGWKGTVGNSITVFTPTGEVLVDLSLRWENNTWSSQWPKPTV